MTDDADIAARRLAADFAISPAAVPELAANLALVAGILRLRPRGALLKDRERAARRRLKADPTDNGAWCDLHRVQAGRAPVVFDLEARSLAVEESRTNRDGRRRTNHQLNAAVAQLRAWWNECHPDDPVTRYAGDDGASRGLRFIAAALAAAGAHATHTTPSALRKRIARLP